MQNYNDYFQCSVETKIEFRFKCLTCNKIDIKYSAYLSDLNNIPFMPTALYYLGMSHHFFEKYTLGKGNPSKCHGPLLEIKSELTDRLSDVVERSSAQRLLAHFASMNLTRHPGKMSVSKESVCYAVAIDTLTKKFYPGVSGGLTNRENVIINDKLKNILDKVKKIEDWDIKNCAEPDAVNEALNAGAKLENILIYNRDLAIAMMKKKEPKAPCLNCTQWVYQIYSKQVSEEYSGFLGIKSVNVQQTPSSQPVQAMA